MASKKHSNKKHWKGMIGTQSNRPLNPEFYKMRKMMQEASAQKFMSLCATCHRICYGNESMTPESIDDAEIQHRANGGLNLAIAWHEPIPPLTKQ